MARQVLTLPDVPATLLTQAVGDARYEPLDSAYTKDEADARYQPVGAYLTQATGDVRYLQTATATTTYVPLAGGSVITGLLGPTTTNTRDLGTSALRWRKLWTTDIDASNQINALYMTISGASATARRLYFQSSTINRWRVGATATAEGGSNAGTDFAIGRFSDAAADLGDALTITRATGNATFGGNLGVGVSPAAWHTARRALQVGATGSLAANPTVSFTELADNSYLDAAAAQRALVTEAAARLVLQQGSMFVWTAPSVAAGAVQTFAQRLMLDQAGNVGIPNAPAAWHPARSALQLGGAAALTGNAGALGTQWSENNYLDASVVDRAIMTGVSTKLSLGYTAGALTFSNAPSVAAGAAQTFTQRLTVGAAGNLVLACDAAVNPFQCTVGGTGSLIIANGASTATNARLYVGPGSLELDPATGYITPPVDNTKYLGAASLRFTGAYFANAPVVGSSLDLKEDIAPLDPVACAESVLATDWVDYTYKAPPPPARDEATKDEHWDAQQTAYATMLVETAAGRRQKGYVLGSPDHAVGDLFGLPDRKTRSDGADIAVVACALQHCLLEIAELKARLA